MTHYLTPAQLASRWKMARGSIDNMRNRGEGPCYVKLGTAKSSPVRYLLSDVEEYEKKFKKSVDISETPDRITPSTQRQEQ